MFSVTRIAGTFEEWSPESAKTHTYGTTKVKKQKTDTNTSDKNTENTQLILPLNIAIGLQCYFDYVDILYLQ